MIIYNLKSKNTKFLIDNYNYNFTIQKIHFLFNFKYIKLFRY